MKYKIDSLIKPIQKSLSLGEIFVPYRLIPLPFAHKKSILIERTTNLGFYVNVPDKIL